MHLFLNEIQQLLFAVVFFHDLIIDIRPVETGNEFRRIGQFEIVLHIGAGFRIGGGGERDTRHVWITVGQNTELLVFGAKIVPPLAHAMRFVNGKQADGGVVQKAQKAFGDQPFGRDIQKFQAACMDIVRQPAHRFGRRAAVDGGGMDTSGAQVGDLVVHQRNQRRHDHSHAFAHQRRDLITQRFSAARGHEHQRVAALRHGIDNFGLPAAEGGVAEGVL